MAVAFGATLGEVHTSGSTTTKTLVTTASVPSGGKIILNVVGYRPVAGVGSVAGGSLTWNIDKQQSGVADTGYRAGIVSADAPAGLASGTSIVATFPGAFDSCGMCAYYITGAATTTPVDVTGGVGYSSNGTSASANLTTTNADDFIAATLFVDFMTADITPAASMTEVYDVAHGDGNKMHAAYRIVSSTGTYTIGGTWTGANAWVTAGVAYKAAASAVANSGFFALM